MIVTIYMDNLFKGTFQLCFRRAPPYLLLEVERSNFHGAEQEVLENWGNLAS